MLMVMRLMITSDATNGKPFKVSLANTVGTVAPVVPFTVVGASFTASMVVTTTFVVAVSHTVGLATWQIVYVTGYVPAGVPAGTVTVPSGFNTNPAGNTPEVKITSDGTNGKPFMVSLANTLGVLPPGVPLIGVGASFTASIVVTITLVVAVSQTVRLAT